MSGCGGGSFACIGGVENMWRGVGWETLFTGDVGGGMAVRSIDSVPSVQME